MQYDVMTTVVTPATELRLTSLLNVKSDLNIDDSDPATDIYLSRLIKQVSASIGQFCNRTFALQTYQDFLRYKQDVNPVFMPISTPPITVANVPLVSVTSIVADGTTLVAGTDFEVDLTRGEIFRLSGTRRCMWFDQAVTVVYKAGWTLPAATVTNSPNPLVTTAPDVEDACIRIIKARYLARDRDPFLKTDTVIGIGSQEYWIPNTPTGNMPPDVEDLLDNYRLPVIG